MTVKKQDAHKSSPDSKKRNMFYLVFCDIWSRQFAERISYEDIEKASDEIDSGEMGGMEGFDMGGEAPDEPQPLPQGGDNPPQEKTPAQEDKNAQKPNMAAAGIG